MKKVLTKLTTINSYHDWLSATVNALELSSALPNELLTQLQQRDYLGSVQIAEHVIMPHIVNQSLPDSWLIVSQLDRPVRYMTSNSITTGIFVLSRPADSSVTDAVDHLTDESVIRALQDPQLSQRQLQGLFS